jgi:hypothetical protein
MAAKIHPLPIDADGMPVPRRYFAFAAIIIGLKRCRHARAAREHKRQHQHQTRNAQAITRPKQNPVAA